MNKHKNVIILYFVGISIFFINPINAELINGGFETGDTTGWNVFVDDVYGWTAVSGSYAYNSNYGIKFYADPDYGESVYVHVEQIVDVTYVDSISFDYKDEHKSGEYAGKNFLYLGGVKLMESSTQDTWTHREYDISAYTGNRNIAFKCGKYNVNWQAFYLDNVELKYSTGLTFYPTLLNVTPTHINYTISDENASSEYSLFIYRNVSNVSTYIDYVGWYDYGGSGRMGSAPIEINDYGANCTYYAKLSTVEDGIIGTVEREYIFDGSINPFPTPQPTPNITALPTYTPQPTPTGYPNQSLINNSLNSSWASAWFNLVENTISGLFLPIYNFWGWILHPVNLLHDILADFSNQMSIFFDEASNKIVIATGILNTIFLYIPDKIVNLIGYYLLWLCIILVFKGDT